MSVRRNRLLAAAVVVLLCGSSLVWVGQSQAAVLGNDGQGIPQQTNAGGIGLEIRPQNTSIGTDGSIRYAVVATNVSGGVGAYNISITLTDGSAADITDYGLSGSPGLTSVTFGDRNDTVRLVVGLADIPASGEVTIANVTVRGASDGVTAVDLSVITIADETGATYTVNTIRDARLVVGNPSTETSSTTTTRPTTSQPSTSTDETTTRPTSTTAVPTTSGDGGPGFTIAIAVISLLIATFLALSRNN